jgi:hypothetical protein
MCDRTADFKSLTTAKVAWDETAKNDQLKNNRPAKKTISQKLESRFRSCQNGKVGKK